MRGLPVIFNDTAQVRLFTSSIGLLILLMYFPGGLMQIVYSLRDAVLAWADRRLGDARRRGAGAGDRQAGPDARHPPGARRPGRKFRGSSCAT